MINIDMINNLDDINNFRELQKTLLEIGIEPGMVSNCAVMETIILELQKAAFSHKKPNITIDSKTLKIGDTELIVADNGNVTIEDFVSKEYKGTVFTNHRPVKITHTNNRKYEYTIVSKYPNATGKSSLYETEVDKSGVVVRQDNLYEWYQQAFIRKEDDNQRPYIRYIHGTSDVEEVMNPPAPQALFDNGDPTNIIWGSIPFDSQRAKVLIERYPVLGEWYESRFGKDYDLDTITSSTGKFDKPESLSDNREEYRKYQLTAIDTILDTLKIKIKHLKDIDLIAAFGKVKGHMIDSKIQETLSIVDIYKSNGFANMSLSQLQLYISFLETTVTRFDSYIIQSNTRRLSYKIKKAANTTKRVLSRKKPNDMTDDNIM